MNNKFDEKFFDEKIIEYLSSIQDNFDKNNVKDYQNLILIIFNSIFCIPASAEVQTKIKEVLITVIDSINTTDKSQIIDILYNILTPYYLQDDLILRTKGDN